MQIVPYLTFNGNAEDAIALYVKALHAKIDGLMRFNEMPPSDDLPPITDDYKNKVLHASLKLGDQWLYVSDNFPGMPLSSGDQITVNINCDSEEQLRFAFDTLADGGQITMPVDHMFWGSLYGAVIDQYGISWSFNFG